jgi:hypothetical protein
MEIEPPSWKRLCTRQVSGGEGTAQNRNDKGAGSTGATGSADVAGGSDNGSYRNLQIRVARRELVLVRDHHPQQNRTTVCVESHGTSAMDASESVPSAGPSADVFARPS